MEYGRMVRHDAKEAAKGAAGGDHQVIAAEAFGRRPEPEDFAVANHAADKKRTDVDGDAGLLEL